ncbi:hypothetical protein [Litorimonas sp. WD9-15]|uniref:hypothetical protein n=1 Tax=Litorimonas sp. WD9-15 TaxID=3418716 RepID=UPI003D074AB3
MKPYLFISAIFLAACGPSQDLEAPTAPTTPVASTERAQPATPPSPTLPESNLEDVDFSAYSTDLARFVGFELGETRLETIDKIRLYYAPETGSTIITTASQTYERDDGSVFLFSRTGLPDDSVQAEEVYAIFSGPGGADKFNQTLAAYGMRIKCYRGENTTEWQTDLCP